MQTILVVDDCAETLETISLILQDIGYEAVAVSDPEEALRMCRQVNCDLVICGLYMTGPTGFGAALSLGGLDVLWNLADEFPQIPIIAMSGKLDKACLDKMKCCGIKGTLSKPFGIPELVSEINAALKAK